MNKKLFYILILLILFLSGCWDVKEAERMYYVHGVGVDYKDGKYEVYIQIIDFANIAKTEQPNPQALQTEIAYGTGDSMYEAIFDLYNSVDREIFWGHFSFIVLSDEVLKEGRANQVIDAFSRFRETSYHIWAYATKESIKEILVVTPILNKSISLSKLADPLNAFRQRSFITPINFRKMIIQLNEPNHQVALPWITLEENLATEKGPDTGTKLTGVSVFSPEDFKGVISGKDARGLQWMSNKTERAEITVNIDSETISIILTNIKVKVKPRFNNGEVKFDVNVKMDALATEIKTKVHPDMVRSQASKQIKKEIENTYKEALKNEMDIYRLSEDLYRHNVSVWKKLNKKGEIDLTEDSINVKVEIRRVNLGRKLFEETIE